MADSGRNLVSSGHREELCADTSDSCGAFGTAAKCTTPGAPRPLACTYSIACRHPAARPPAAPGTPTPGRLKRVLASFNAVRAAQRDTIRLLTYLTRPIVNGESPTQIFAKLEDARHHLEWGRGRKLRRHAEETGLQARLADESAQQAPPDAAPPAQAADPDSYRIQWHPEGPLQEARR